MATHSSVLAWAVDRRARQAAVLGLTGDAHD